MQRPKEPALLQGFIRLSSLIERILRIEVGPGLHCLLEPFNLLEADAHQLLGADLTQPYFFYCFNGP